MIRTGSQFPLTVRSSEDILSLQNIMRLSTTGSTTFWAPATAVTCTLRTADLADKDNWSLAYTSHENVPLVELIVNTPYGAVS